MRVEENVQQCWQQLSRRVRRITKARSRHAPCAVLRCRCKVIVGLVQGHSPTVLARGGLCSASQVDRLAERFVEHGPAGLVDERNYIGAGKVDESGIQTSVLRCLGSAITIGLRDRNDVIKNQAASPRPTATRSAPPVIAAPGRR